MCERQAQQLGVAVGGGDQVGALLRMILGVHVGTARDQVARRGHVVAPGGGDQGTVVVGQGLGRQGAAAQQNEKREERGSHRLSSFIVLAWRKPTEESMATNRRV